MLLCLSFRTFQSKADNEGHAQDEHQLIWEEHDRMYSYIYTSRFDPNVEEDEDTGAGSRARVMRKK